MGVVAEVGSVGRVAQVGAQRNCVHAPLQQATSLRKRNHLVWCVVVWRWLCVVVLCVVV